MTPFTLPTIVLLGLLGTFTWVCAGAIKRTGQGRYVLLSTICLLMLFAIFALHWTGHFR